MTQSMRQPNREIRDAVLKSIALVMYRAQREGRDPFKVAEAAFPGTPLEVVASAFSTASDVTAEDWWQMVEDTVNGEVIKTAVASVDHKQQAKRE